MLYDGHGSTRQLIADNGTTVTASYSYDAYGVMLGTDDTAAENADTSLLYAGEQYDSDLDHYYLRARYYNPWSGTFNRSDPFAGNNQDPQSLHKYLCCHNNPINNIDPSGQFTLVQLVIVVAIIAVLFALTIHHFITRPMGLMATAVPLDRGVAIAAIEQMKRDIWQNVNVDDDRYAIKSKMSKLASWMEECIPFWNAEPRVKTIEADEDDITGLNFRASKYLYVSQEVVENRNHLDVAIVIFGEFQHHPNGGNLGEQAAMDEFVVMRRQIPENERTAFINTRRHGGTENVQ